MSVWIVVTMHICHQALDGPDVFQLTWSQVNHIIQMRATGNSMDITMCMTKLTAMTLVKLGGWSFISVHIAGLVVPFICMFWYVLGVGYGYYDRQLGKVCSYQECSINEVPERSHSWKLRVK